MQVISGNRILLFVILLNKKASKKIRYENISKLLYKKKGGDSRNEMTTFCNVYYLFLSYY